MQVNEQTLTNVLTQLCDGRVCKGTRGNRKTKEWFYRPMDTGLHGPYKTRREATVAAVSYYFERVKQV